MRGRLGQIAILTVVCVLAEKSHVQAASAVCPPRSASAADDKGQTGRRISVVQVTFLGSLQLPIPDQDQIADSIKQQSYREPLDVLVDEAVEKVRAGWQDRGYFKAQVNGKETTLTSGPANRRIALTFQVDEGLQYSLKEITFKSNQGITDVAALRSLFPINDGDIFSREKIASGLDNLRKAFGDLGYMNFTSLPNAEFEDETKQISLDMDFDVGKRFVVARVDVLGLDEPARQELLNDLPIKQGQLWTTTIASSLVKYDSILPHCECREEILMNERSGTVTVTLDFRPCPTD
jgi:outer membrane protein assembly factor BamA